MPFRVVIAGAGVAALETALALGALAGDLVSVPARCSGAGIHVSAFGRGRALRAGQVRRFPLSALVAATGAALRRGAVARVDPDGKVALLEDGEALEFDVFVLALGARAREAVAGALTFRGREDGQELAALLDRATGGNLRRVVFAVPAAITWPLPLYELALLTAGYLTDHGTRGVDVLLVTPEERPLALFGPEASEAVAGAARDSWHRAPHRNRCDRVARWPARGGRPAPIEADAVVALPQLIGHALPGLPHDGSGFVPTDRHGRVTGTADVYAAGDSTQFPAEARWDRDTAGRRSRSGDRRRCRCRRRASPRFVR